MPTNLFERDIVSKEEKILDQENSQLIQQIILALNAKTGWKNTPGVTLSFTDGTRTFTVTPTGSSFEYWINKSDFHLICLSVSKRLCFTTAIKNCYSMGRNQIV